MITVKGGGVVFQDGIVIVQDADRCNKYRYRPHQSCDSVFQGKDSMEKYADSVVQDTYRCNYGMCSSHKSGDSIVQDGDSIDHDANRVVSGL